MSSVSSVPSQPSQIDLPIPPQGSTHARLSRSKALTYARAQAVDRVRRIRPRNLKDLLHRCEFTLRHLNSGIYRDVYHIVGLPLVVKIPIPDKDFKDNLHHAKMEHKAYQRIKRSTRKFSSIQPFLPQVHYFDTRSGIILVEKYRMAEYDTHCDAFLAMEKAVSSLMGVRRVDVDNVGNIGLDRKGNYRLLDLGFLQEGM